MEKWKNCIEKSSNAADIKFKLKFCRKPYLKNVFALLVYLASFDWSWQP